MFQRGEHVGPCIIEGLLSTGASSEVYAATLDERPVALKILRREQRGSPLALRMSNEGQALAQIDHPGVVTLLYSDVYHQRPYLVLERLPCSLAQAMPLPVPRAVALVAALAQTLAALHRIGIVHRDLKPHNVMLSAGGDARLVDFGIAKLPVSQGAPDLPLLPLSTAAGDFLGTYEYAAPEQINDSKSCAGSSDVYALGVMLFELLAGRRPFTAAQRGHLISQHLNEAPPPLSSLVSGLPAELPALVARMLRKRPEARPSASEVAEVLLRANHPPRARRLSARALLLLLVPLLPALAPRREADDFERVLFSQNIPAAEEVLREAERALRARADARPADWAKLAYKQAGLAKERADLQGAKALYESAQAQWRAQVSSQRAQAYRALSICADGLGEIAYHRGDAAQALAQYQESERTLRFAMTAGVGTRQVSSYLPYQAAQAYLEQGQSAAARSALAQAEEHERTLLERSQDPLDHWQLGRVLALRAEGAAEGEKARLLREALSHLDQALRARPDDHRFQLARLLAEEALARAAPGDARADGEAALRGLRALAQADPQNGRWTHALAEVLVRRALMKGGAAAQAPALAEAQRTLDQIAARGQWRDDVHLRRWRERLAEAAGGGVRR